MINEMLGALIGLGRAVEGNKNKPDSKTHIALLKGCNMCLYESNYSRKEINYHIDLLHREKYQLVERCLKCNKQCGRNDDYNLEGMMTTGTEEDLRRLLLSQIISLGAILYGKEEFDIYDKEVLKFIYDALFVAGCNQLDLLERSLNKGRNLIKQII